LHSIFTEGTPLNNGGRKKLKFTQCMIYQVIIFIVHQFVVDRTRKQLREMSSYKLTQILPNVPGKTLSATRSVDPIKVIRFDARGLAVYIPG
jgi:hypothetical protein